MKPLVFSLCAALLSLGAFSPSVAAQDGDAAQDASNPICTFHGEGCSAPPAEWVWQRLEPRTGDFSVEIPCNGEQTDAFGRLLALSRAQFEAGATRACMKAAAGFTATVLGVVHLPEGAAIPAEVEELLQGAPDLFTALVRQIGAGSKIEEVTMFGRRAIVNTVESDDGYARVAIIEVSRFGILMLNGDIRAGLKVTRAEGDALLDRFFGSLEFAQ